LDSAAQKWEVISRSSVGHDVGRYAVFREYVSFENVGQVLGGDGRIRGDEDCHLRESIDDYEDGIVSIGFWKFFDEVHRDGKLWSFWYW
jgi:hypothetical protein